MMSKGILSWVGIFVVLGLLVALRFTASEGPWGGLWQPLYGLAYCLLGILLLALFARLLADRNVLVWRPLMLVSGAALAGLEQWLLDRFWSLPASAEIWMTALLGLVVAAILARLAPASIAHLWLGVERRAGR
jgi:hypothetical protein